MLMTQSTHESYAEIDLTGRPVRLASPSPSSAHRGDPGAFAALSRDECELRVSPNAVYAILDEAANHEPSLSIVTDEDRGCFVRHLGIVHSIERVVALGVEERSCA